MSVSILVVLELATRPGIPAAVFGRSTLFQSLLCWNWLPGPAMVIRRSRYARMFQSLLCWNWLPGSGSGPMYSLGCSVFQSLLCWNWLPGGRGGDVGHAQRQVSILVVLELATRLCWGFRIGLSWTAFQSLLCWNWLPG